MMDVAATLTAHYDTGAILDRIKAGLAAAGADPEAPKPEDLKGVDEFHIGGLEATEALLDPLGITAEMSALDVGSGIGGTARFIASRYGAYVHGVDLTPAFVDLANTLSAMCGLDHRCSCLQGSALSMPVSDASFDVATMIHVGMNIEDKPALFAEVARCLKPGGRFAVYDVMALSNEAVDFPVPWSSGPETSFVAPPQAYRDAAAAAGFELVSERDRSDFARDFFARVKQATEANGPPPVGLQLIMGDETRLRVGNMVKAVSAGRVSPWEMVFQKG